LRCGWISEPLLDGLNGKKERLEAEHTSVFQASSREVYACRRMVPKRNLRHFFNDAISFELLSVSIDRCKSRRAGFGVVSHRMRGRSATCFS
jgi:hypothetical protein